MNKTKKTKSVIYTRSKYNGCTDIEGMSRYKLIHMAYVYV